MSIKNKIDKLYEIADKLKKNKEIENIELSLKE